MFDTTVTDTTTTIPAADSTLTQLSTEKPLTETERTEFDQHRRFIAETIASNVEMTVRLMDIKERKLYREDFGTWEEFCKSLLQLTAVSVNNRIRTYQIRQALQKGEVDAALLPTEDRPYRPLLSVKDENMLATVFNKALELANGKALTEDLMSKAVKACVPPTDDPPKAKTKNSAHTLKLISEVVNLLPNLDITTLPLSEILKIRQLRNGLQAFENHCQAALRPRDIEVEAEIAEPASA